MLEALEIRNLKACKSLDTGLSPLTILAGLNSSGKSSVLQSIALLRQSHGRMRAGGGLALNGDWIALGTGKDVLNENAEEEEIALGLREDGDWFRWRCQCLPESNVLPFVEEPEFAPRFLRESFQYIKADRITPATMYPSAPQHVRDIDGLGGSGEFTVDFLVRNRALEVREARRIRERGLAQTPNLMDQAAAWLQYISPGVSPIVEQLRGTDYVRLSFQYGGKRRDVRSTEYRPTNVGFGLTYALPPIIACLAAKPGSIVLLENPEAHLHPRGQSALALLLAQCSADGVQLLVETHSDHLLNGVRIAVRRKVVSASSVALHYFNRDLESGNAAVQSPVVQENGRLTFWPEGFFDQWEKSLDELLD